MKKTIIMISTVLLALAGCGTKSESGSGSGLSAAADPTPQVITIKESPDKYTAYIKNYVGRNCASIGYESLGGDRNDHIGKGYIQLVMITEDGTYVGVDDESLKDYVVVAQSYAPNTEVKFTYDTDSEGKEYDNLIRWQNVEEIVLKVKHVGSNERTTDKGMTAISIPADRYTSYVRDYVGRNLASCGYVSLGGEYRDEYGASTMKLELIADDGSYIDLSDSESLQNYYVTAQNPAPNTEIKYEFDTKSNGEEFNFTKWESLNEIELYITKINTADASVQKGTSAVEEQKENTDSDEQFASQGGNESQNSSKEEQAKGTSAITSTVAEAVEEKADNQTDNSEENTEVTGAATGYESIYNDYSQRLREATPGLIEEYKSDIQSNTEGISGLATICNDKVQKLATITNDGVGELANYYMHNGSGKYSEYEEWSGKLYDVYSEEAAKIYDAYTASIY